MSRLKHLVKSMEPEIGQRSCRLIWDSSCGAINRKVTKTVGVEKVVRKPRRKSLVAARISFFEDRDCQVSLMVTADHE